MPRTKQCARRKKTDGVILKKVVHLISCHASNRQRLLMATTIHTCKLCDASFNEKACWLLHYKNVHQEEVKFACCSNPHDCRVCILIIFFSGFLIF